MHPPAAAPAHPPKHHSHPHRRGGAVTSSGDEGVTSGDDAGDKGGRRRARAAKRAAMGGGGDGVAGAGGGTGARKVASPSKRQTQHPANGRGGGVGGSTLLHRRTPRGGRRGGGGGGRQGRGRAVVASPENALRAFRGGGRGEGEGGKGEGLGAMIPAAVAGLPVAPDVPGQPACMDLDTSAAAAAVAALATGDAPGAGAAVGLGVEAAGADDSAGDAVDADAGVEWGDVGDLSGEGAGALVPYGVDQAEGGSGLQLRPQQAQTPRPLQQQQPQQLVLRFPGSSLGTLPPGLPAAAATLGAPQPPPPLPALAPLLQLPAPLLQQLLLLPPDQVQQIAAALGAPAPPSSVPPQAPQHVQQHAQYAQHAQQQAAADQGGTSNSLLSALQQAKAAVDQEDVERASVVSALHRVHGAAAAAGQAGPAAAAGGQALPHVGAAALGVGLGPSVGYAGAGDRSLVSGGGRFSGLVVQQQQRQPEAAGAGQQPNSRLLSLKRSHVQQLYHQVTVHVQQLMQLYGLARGDPGAQVGVGRCIEWGLGGTADGEGQIWQWMPCECGSVHSELAGSRYQRPAAAALLRVGATIPLSPATSGCPRHRQNTDRCILTICTVLYHIMHYIILCARRTSSSAPCSCCSACSSATTAPWPTPGSMSWGPQSWLRSEKLLQGQLPGRLPQGQLPPGKVPGKLPRKLRVKLQRILGSGGRWRRRAVEGAISGTWRLTGSSASLTGRSRRLQRAVSVMIYCSSRRS